MKLLERIDSSFGGFLRAHGFQQMFHGVDEKFFGNTTLVYRSDKIALRFVTDRGDLLIDVNTTVQSENWCTLDFCLELLGYPWSSTAGLSDLEIESIMVREYNRVAALFAPENVEDTRQRLELLAKRPLPKLN